MEWQKIRLLTEKLLKLNWNAKLKVILKKEII